MSHKIAKCFAATVALFVGTQNALADDNLFKGYAYNSPLESYSVAKGYYDCSEEIGGTARCIDDVDFIGNKFTAALIFSGGKLIMVSLFSPFDQELYTKAITTLSKTFTLVSMMDDTTLFDVIDLAATAKSKDEYRSKLTNFESVGLSTGNLTYTFLEGAEIKSNLRSAASMLAAAPDNVRCADLMLTGQGAEAALLIRFNYPKLEKNKAVEVSKEPVEAF